MGLSFHCYSTAREGETTTEEPGTSSSSLATNQRKETDEEAGPSTSSTEEQAKKKAEGEKEGEEKGEVVEAVLTEEDLIQQSQAEYDSGRYSPTLLTSSELPLDTHTTVPEEDLQRLHLARKQLQDTGMRLHTHTENIHMQLSHNTNITVE